MLGAAFHMWDVAPFIQACRRMMPGRGEISHSPAKSVKKYGEILHIRHHDRKMKKFDICSIIYE